MRSQLDETIRAKQQIAADSKVRQDQPAKFSQTTSRLSHQLMQVHGRKVPQNHPVGVVGRNPPRKAAAKPVHGRRARTAQSAAVIGADGTVVNMPSASKFGHNLSINARVYLSMPAVFIHGFVAANRHRRPVTEQHSRPRPRADVQDDIEILMAYYSEYDPKLATQEKVNAIIGVFPHSSLIFIRCLPIMDFLGTGCRQIPWRQTWWSVARRHVCSNWRETRCEPARSVSR